MGTEGIWEFSVLSIQFYCEFKTLKMAIFLKNQGLILCSVQCILF